MKARLSCGVSDIELLGKKVSLLLISFESESHSNCNYFFRSNIVIYLGLLYRHKYNYKFEII